MPPLGMREGYPLPVDVSRIAPAAFAGEVVMKVEETPPFLHAAAARGCRTQVGTDMLFEMIPAYLEFFGFGSVTPEELRSLSPDRSEGVPAPRLAGNFEPDGGPFTPEASVAPGVPLHAASRQVPPTMVLAARTASASMRLQMWSERARNSGVRFRASARGRSK